MLLAGQYLPAGHGSGTIDPLEGHRVPPGHASHTAADPLAAYEPGEHSIGPDDPTPHDAPAGHATHAVAADVFAYEPASHGVQLCAAVALLAVPALHGEQALAFAAPANHPGAHAVCTPLEQALPAPQAATPVAPRFCASAPTASRPAGTGVGTVEATGQ